MKANLFDRFLVKFLPICVVVFSLMGVASLVGAFYYWRTSAAVGAAVSFATSFAMQKWLVLVRKVVDFGA